MANDFWTGLVGGVSTGLEQRRKKQEDIDTLLMTLGLKSQFEMPMKEREFEQQKELEKAKAQYRQEYPSASDLYFMRMMGIPTGEEGGVSQIQPTAFTEEEARKRIPTGQETQYEITPKTQMIKGIPTTIYETAKKKKKTLSSAQLDSLNLMSNTIQNLENLKTSSETGKFKTGPMSFRFQQAPFSQKYMGTFGTPEEAAFKSTLVDTQASYITAKTGAQRGFKEIQWLEAAMPSADLPPEKFIKVAEEAIKRLKKNYQNALESAKKGGYEMSEFEKQQIPTFLSEEEAEASGYKGEAIVGGRRARVD